jgi:hypothetical protein
MRGATRAFVALMLAIVPLQAQESASAPAPSRTEQTPRANRAQSSQEQERRDRLRKELRLLRLSGEDAQTPSADSFAIGGRTIAAGDTVEGPVGAADGDLIVDGVVNGDAMVIGGNLVVRRGGVVTGNALAVGGHVQAQGGRVDGEMRSLSGVATDARTPTRAARPWTTWQSIKLVIGCFAILFVIGVGVLMFAEGNIDGVVIALERSFTKAFWLGLLGQLALLPALLLLLVGLTLTVLGILLIPFAIVAFCIAAAGLVTLGFLASARLTGGFAAQRGGTARSQSLRTLLIGVSAYAALWLLAAGFTWQPVAGSVLRGIATIVTWVAATAGLGAVLASRAGTQRPGTRTARRAAPRDDLAWQTPTPVTGVAAARRPRTASVKET